MEQQTQENKFESRKYWITLPSFYADKATLSLSVIDSDCKVMVRIASVLPGAEGRPQAGQQKYDHKNAANFALNIFEVQALVSAYRYGIVANEPVSFLHQNNNASIIATFGTFNGRFNFSIRNVATGMSHQYFFNSHKAGKDSQTYIPHEVELFVNMLESVVKDVVMLSSKFLPASQTQTNQRVVYNQQSVQQPQQVQQNYQQQVYQQPAPQPQQVFNQQPAPANQYSSAPGTVAQQPMNPMTPQGNGLPSSSNEQNVGMFDF